MTSGGPPGPEPFERLVEVLEESRRLGFLGPGPLAPQIDHARGFASLQERTPESFLDLGSGGGLPGLVLALEWPHARAALLDAMKKRSEFLARACARLGIDGRVEVVGDRAETAARRSGLREAFDLVVARSFGPPAVTAECAVGFLRLGGRLIVSEPPDDVPGRWPAQGLSELGLGLEDAGAPDRRFVVLSREATLEARFPRRVGVPAKRPLWR